MTPEIAHDDGGQRLTLMPDGRCRREDPSLSRAFGSGPDGVAEVLTRLVTNGETGRCVQVKGVRGFTKAAALSAATTSLTAGPLSGHEAFRHARAHVPLLPQPYRLVSCKGSRMVWGRSVEPDVETTRIFRRVDQAACLVTCSSAASSTSSPAPSRLARSDSTRRQPRAPGRPANSASMCRVIW